MVKDFLREKAQSKRMIYYIIINRLGFRRHLWLDTPRFNMSRVYTVPI